MVKNLLTLLFIFCGFVSLAQETKIKIGELNNEVITLTETQKNLSKAFEWTFRDGTRVVDLQIEQMQQTWFLVATCTYQNRKRIAAVNLELQGIQFYLPEDAQFRMCSAVACENCRFFLENNKIVACKCEETSTISNHCHYKAGSASTYYNNLIRAKTMFEE